MLTILKTSPSWYVFGKYQPYPSNSCFRFWSCESLFNFVSGWLLANWLAAFSAACLFFAFSISFVISSIVALGTVGNLLANSYISYLAAPAKNELTIESILSFVTPFNCFLTITFNMDGWSTTIFQLNVPEREVSLYV